MFNFIFKPLQQVLFGRTTEMDYRMSSRISTFNIPTSPEREATEFKYRLDDGLLPTLIFRLQDLEKEVAKLKSPEQIVPAKILKANKKKK